MQRVGLSAAAVQCGHEQPPEPLAQRIAEEGGLQRRDGLAVALLGQLGFEQQLARGRAQFAQPDDLGLGEGGAGDVGQGVAVPERQRVADCGGRRGRGRAVRADSSRAANRSTSSWSGETSRT